jgi:N-acetylmuramoyl-L-alanine amidase
VNGAAFVNRVQASPNFEPRFVGKKVNLLVLHYTGMASGPSAVDWLCNPSSKVSCHYLVDVDGCVVQMVDEAERAWHAGVSSWHGEIDINSTSIGIEIQNLGHTAGCLPFPPDQMQAVAKLSLDIMVRHNLRPEDVVAHSDIAPGRKVDPGEAFDWPFLARHGIGRVAQAARAVQLPAGEVQAGLRRLGYGITQSGVFDDQTRIVLKAFQRRYRRGLVDGKADGETCDLITRLCAMVDDEKPLGASHDVPA